MGKLLFAFLIYTESAEKYDPRDVERLEKDDSYTKSFLTWRHFIVEDTLKMIDESFQWRKELGVNGRMMVFSQKALHKHIYPLRSRIPPSVKKKNLKHITIKYCNAL